jgi:hypothetical protein
MANRPRKFYFFAATARENVYVSLEKRPRAYRLLTPEDVLVPLEDQDRCLDDAEVLLGTTIFRGCPATVGDLREGHGPDMYWEIENSSGEIQRMSIHSVGTPLSFGFRHILSANVIRQAMKVGRLPRVMVHRTRIREALLNPTKADRSVPAWRIRSIRERCAANVIQRRFREAISDPEYGLCQKRLLREYTVLVSH